MKFSAKIATLLGILFFVGCSTGAYDRKTKQYRDRSPIAEAVSDYESRDHTIYSAMGVGHYYPGLDYNEGRRISEEHGQKMLEGTTDFLESHSQMKYVRTATSFAAEYNRKKAALLLQNDRRIKEAEQVSGGSDE